MLLKRHVGFSKIVIICNTLMIFGFVFTELVVAKDSLPAFLGIPTKILWIILGPRGRIFMGAGYISIGMLLAKYDEKTKKKYALLILGATVTTLTSGFAGDVVQLCISYIYGFGRCTTYASMERKNMDWTASLLQRALVLSWVFYFLPIRING